MRMVALIQKRQQQNAAQPNHRRPAPPRNTLLTVNLLNRGTPYSQSQRIFPTALRNTLLALNFPEPQNNLLIVVLPDRGTPFSSWTRPTCSTLHTQSKKTFQLNCKGREQTDIIQTDIANHRTNWPRGRFVENSNKTYCCLKEFHCRRHLLRCF